MPTNLSVTVTGLLPLRRQIQLLSLPLATRKRVLSKVAKKVISSSKKRVSSQTDLQSSRFQRRWKPRTDRRKMLSKLARQMAVNRNTGDEAVIGFRGGLSGIIAAKQQHGFSQTVTATQNRRERGREYYDNPATKQQAKALRLLGYKHKQGGARLQRVSSNWIMSNLTIAQAGAIIKSMRAKQGQPARTSWTTNLPARSFLGATPQEASDYVETILDDVLSRLRAA